MVPSCLLYAQACRDTAQRRGKRKKKNCTSEKKEEILGNLVASQSARHFLLWQMWFLSFKKVLQQCDYDKSAQIACDTERRMNGHVKSMSFQQFMELATSKFSNFIFLGHQEKQLDTIASFLDIACCCCCDHFHCLIAAGRLTDKF